jgi:integrase
MAITQLKDGRWVVYYRDPAVHKDFIKRESFGRGPDAERRALARNRDLGLSSQRKRQTAADGPVVSELARDYAEAHQFATDRARWQHELRMDSRVLPFFGAIPAARLADSDLDRYIRSRRSAGVSYSTIRRELVDLKAILNWAHRRRPPAIPFNPIRDYHLPKEDLEVIMPPTAAELAAIMAAAPEHLRRIIMLAYYLGLRPGPVECYRLRWENVDWNAGTILVTGAKKGGGDRRSVPIHPELLPAMTEWSLIDAEKEIPWIIHWGGKPPEKISTVWARVLSDAKITRRLRPYDLRHLFVTQALERGADVKSLSAVVGSSPETLMRFYQHVTTTMHRRTVSLIPAMRHNDDTKQN